jgi:hypothetical protein
MAIPMPKAKPIPKMKEMHKSENRKWPIRAQAVVL